VTRVPLAATAFPLRRNGIACDVGAYWTAANGQRASREWIDALSTKLPVDEDGTYVNGMDRVGESSVRRAYGANYARLQHVKARYDPHNLFSLNQNIRPVPTVTGSVHKIPSTKFPRALECEGISAEKEIPTQTGCVEEEEDQ